jgi:tetratricopeptide (TPR) repeat protein
MEYAEGTPLKGPIPSEQAIAYGVAILNALDAAHQKGLAHGELKAADILVTKQGIKLPDFGRPASRENVQADIYWFGGVLYEMLMGRPLEQRRPVQPAPLEAVLKKCLDPDPARRWQSTGELKAALQQALHKRSYLREYIFGAAALVMLFGGLALLLFQVAPGRPLTDQDVVILADFTNNTGDPVFDDSLRAALARQLEQSPYLKLLDDERMQEDLQGIGRPPGERITPAIARQICMREGDKATIEGSIADLGNAYSVTVQVSSCDKGEILAREEVRTLNKEQILKAVSTVATSLRSTLGETLTSVQKLDRPFDAASLASLEAWQAYARGRALVEQNRYAEAAPLLERSTELDPNFAMAYRFLAIAAQYSGNERQAEEYLEKAFALRDRVTEREGLLISGDYSLRTTGDLNQANEAYQMLAGLYPRDEESRLSLGVIYASLGEFSKAAEQARDVIRLAPQSAEAYRLLINASMRLGRFDDAKAAAQSALAQNLDVANVHQDLLRIAYIHSDDANVKKEIQWFAGNPAEYLSFREQAQDAIVSGEFGKASELLQMGAEAARRSNLNAAVAPLLGQAASLGEFRDDCAMVREIGAVAALLCADAGGALKSAEEQVNLRPQDTLLNAVRLPVVAATVELQHGDPAKAIKLLQRAAPYENANSQIPYLQGIAYLRLNKGAEAATEFQKILDRKGASWGVVYPLSYLGVGRAAAMSGDTAKAKKAYQDFLALWSDADADLPALVQARKESAGLK